MRHRVIIKDCRFNEYTTAEGWGNIILDDEELRVFIGGMNFPNILYTEDCRGKEIEVELKILPAYVTPIEIKKRMILRLTKEDTWVPKYLFIGEVKKKKRKEDNKKIVVFDCGFELDVDITKFAWFNELKEGDYILVVGFLHMYGMNE